MGDDPHGPVSSFSILGRSLLRTSAADKYRGFSMIHKNWLELIKPTQLVVKPGADPQRLATVIAEPLERAAIVPAAAVAATPESASLMDGLTLPVAVLA